jgi:uncharacterized membrane protein YhaH (DUF805 family)
MGQIDFNKVWQNFLGTVTGHYMDFGGRVGRQQYWAYIAVWGVVMVLAELIASITTLPIIDGIVGLALVLPTGAISARRIQDTGNNGQLAWIFVAGVGLLFALDVYIGFLLLSVSFSTIIALANIVNIYRIVQVVALLASIAMIYFGAQPGQAGDNQYGPPPAPWSPNA